MSVGSGLFTGAAPQAAAAPGDESDPRLAGEGLVLRVEVLGAAPKSPAALAATWARR